MPRFRGDYPPEALQLACELHGVLSLLHSERVRSDAERAAERQRALRAWLTGVPWTASAAHFAAEQVRAAELTTDGPTVRLGIGLELRARSQVSLARSDWATYRRLRDEGAVMPPHIGVCEHCRRVFRTASRAVAFKCPRCHKRSTPTRRQPWHVHVFEEETFDPATGQPSGWAPRRYLVQCVGCGRRFEADRRDRKTCSTRCRVRAHRATTSAPPH